MTIWLLNFTIILAILSKKSIVQTKNVVETQDSAIKLNWFSELVPYFKRPERHKKVIHTFFGLFIVFGMAISTNLVNLWIFLLFIFFVNN